MQSNCAVRVRTAARSLGFTLIETMIVMAVLVVLMGAIFSTINRVQKTYRREEQKIDIAQEARGFYDEIGRELHQAGYPSHNMFAPGVLRNPPANDFREAVGLVRVSPSDLWFEGDIDNDGVVESVRYTLVDSAGAPVTAASTCPCTLRRSQIQKVDNLAPTAQNTNYTSQMDFVLNSGNVAAAGAALNLTGNFRLNGSSVSYDTYYAAYKTPPVFQAFDSAGNNVALPIDVTTNPNGIANIRSLAITLNMLTEFPDPQTGVRPTIATTTTVQVRSY
jgi:prepilin-type N-terminal cleavage/methylation domain-containing protein